MLPPSTPYVERATPKSTRAPKVVPFARTILPIVHGHGHDHGHGHAHGHESGGHGHAAEPHHHAIVDVMLKRSILDPQGRAVQNTLQRLGHDNVVDLRVGKRIEITLLGDGDAVREQLLTIAETVLSNPVMEEVEVAMESHDHSSHYH